MKPDPYKLSPDTLPIDMLIVADVVTAERARVAVREARAVRDAHARAYDTLAAIADDAAHTFAESDPRVSESADAASAAWYRSRASEDWADAIYTAVEDAETDAYRAMAAFQRGDLVVARVTAANARAHAARAWRTYHAAAC